MFPWIAYTCMCPHILLIALGKSCRFSSVRTRFEPEPGGSAGSGSRFYPSCSHRSVLVRGSGEYPTEPDRTELQHPYPRVSWPVVAHVVFGFQFGLKHSSGLKQQLQPLIIVNCVPFKTQHCYLYLMGLRNLQRVLHGEGEIGMHLVGLLFS